MSYARPYDCIFLVHRYLHQNTQISIDLIVRALESAAQTAMPEQMDHPQFAHVAGELFDYLGKHTDDVDEKQHARLEWLYFFILAYSHRGTQVLQREITRSAQFFVELISVAFGSENEDPKEYEQEEIDAARRVNALLEQWKTVPGASEGGKVDPQVLRAWMQQARDGAKAIGRLQAADMIIGRVLVFAPVGEDRVWPDVAVRDLLEEAKSSTMEDHLWSQVYNNRGVVTKSQLEGGGQERGLADRFRDYARATRDQWPRISSVLQRLSDHYASEARHADLRAELHEDMWR